jgi:NADPH:quinone reductase-like Zn-dependent oxidoreductase
MDPATAVARSRRSAAIRVAAKVDSPEALDAELQLKEIDLPRDLPADYVVVEIRSTAVNPSDVRAVLGAMPHAVWPRTPGRDYAGVVVEGPRQLLGREVWGSGGELGIRRDGTHSRHLVLPLVSEPAGKARRHQPRRSGRGRCTLHHGL